MANLAIRGHTTRGKEVIKILEMLGGENIVYDLDGSDDNACYYIHYDYIDADHKDMIGKGHPDFKHYTLEEFLEKFPYKVGDKAFAFGNKCTIIDAVWDGGIDEVVYTIKLDTSKYTTTKLRNQLQPYKEETMDKVNQAVFDANAQCCDIMNSLIKEETMESRPNLLQQLKEYFDNTPRDVLEKEWHEYDKYNEIGSTVKEYLEYVNKSRQPKYPKTFIEVLNFWHPDRRSEDDYQRCYKKELIEKFQDLLYARDAYWKIAGEQMGLGKPWKPDWAYNCIKYIITVAENEIYTDVSYIFNYILVFPTEEMRDAFLENFGHLIEICKELL